MHIGHTLYSPPDWEVCMLGHTALNAHSNTAKEVSFQAYVSQSTWTY